jgi:hypothetical protein
MEKFYRRSGDDPWVNSLVPNDSFPAKFGHLNAIVDELNNGGGIINIKLVATPDDLLTCSSNPIDIGLPQSEIGTYWRVLSLESYLDFNTTEYDEANIGIVSSLTPQGFIFQNTSLAEDRSGIYNSIITSTQPSYTENSKLYIYTNNDPTEGDSTITFYIAVQKVTL